MRGLKRFVRGAGLACLLGTIVLCQSVLVHTEGRAFGREHAPSRRVIHHYELVRVQRVSAELLSPPFHPYLRKLLEAIPGEKAIADEQLTHQTGEPGVQNRIEDAETLLVSLRAPRS